MPESRMIRRHSNRRLWDPQRRGYLVLDDIRDLVVAGTEFNVIDNDRADVTWATLLQVITAQERRADPSLSTEFLRQTLCSQAESPSGLTATFLEQTLRLFHDLAARHKIPRKGASADVLRSARSLAETQYERWRSVEKEINQTLANAISGDGLPPRALGELIGLLPARRLERRSRRSPRTSRVMTRR